MSYQVLARKWRPKNFEQLMGQEHVVTVLTNALSQQRLHHAYLFTGTRGVGKTTIARIFAKSLNCQQGISAQPCGQCHTCEDIDQGRFVDLLEIDAASRTKVDDTREILDNVQYAPSRGRYKVYLIDEVHMLSRSSFNALLKTLEEPPEHVKFILATTDPQKLPITVLSRCLQFHLKALTKKQIETKLAEILHHENVIFESEAIALLAKAARGSMRDSLSLTDQAIAQGHGHIKLDNVQQMLGGVDHHWPFKILVMLIKQQSSELMLLSQEIAAYSPSYQRLLVELLQLLHQVALRQVIGHSFDLSPEQNSLLDKFAQSLSPEEVQLYYQIVLSGRKDLPYAADEQAAFDMTLLRLLAFQPANRYEQLSNTGVQAATELVGADTLPETKAANASLVASLPEQTPHSPMTVSLEASGVNAKQEWQVEPAVDESSLLLVDDSVSQLVKEEPSLTQLSEEMLAIEQTAIDQGYQSAPDQDTASMVENNQAQLEQNETSSLDAVLSTRNMLRSRRKQLENTEKKLDDAPSRHQAEQVPSLIPIAPQRQVDVPELETVPEQPFSVDAIDPSKIKKANQVDKWANMIDSMALSGRLRQLAIHATIDPASTDEQLMLNLDKATKHLASDNAQQQMQQHLSNFLAREITVTIIVVDETEDDPYKIQSQINSKRFDYAKTLLLEDPLVMSLQQDFQAEIDEETIIAK